MLTSLSARLLRRPFKIFIPILLLVSFVILLGHFNRHSQNPVFSKLSSSWLDSKKLEKAESLYYSKDQPPYYSWTTRSFFPPLKERSGSQPPDLCAGFPTKLLDSVQVVLKTGVGEATKNKAHVATVTSCISNLIVVSDVEENVGDQNFIDILADLPASYAVENPDFETYAAQKQAQSQGLAVGHSPEGWRLDKFKFLPMVEKAYEMSPHANWYVFMETDVYYFWDTLFRLLDQLDPATMHYMGSPVPGSDGRFFAYGGAGTVLSRGLMERLVGNPTQPRLSDQYEKWVRNDACGDAVLGYAILDRTGVKLEALYPTFAGDELQALNVDRERWCIPLLALHRMSPEQMTALWQWERTRLYNEEPFLHSTLLAYTHSHLRDGPTREFWDNLSGDTPPADSRAHFSASECSSACAADPDCLQYSYSEKTCRFAHFLMSGKPVNDKSGEFTSGWNVKRMEDMGFKTDGNTSGRPTGQNMSPSLRIFLQLLFFSGDLHAIVPMLPSFRGTSFSASICPLSPAQATKEWRDIEQKSLSIQAAGSRLLRMQAFVGEPAIPDSLFNEDIGCEILLEPYTRYFGTKGVDPLFSSWPPDAFVNPITAIFGKP